MDGLYKFPSMPVNAEFAETNLKNHSDQLPLIEISYWGKILYLKKISQKTSQYVKLSYNKCTMSNKYCKTFLGMSCFMGANLLTAEIAREVLTIPQITPDTPKIITADMPKITADMPKIITADTPKVNSRMDSFFHLSENAMRDLFRREGALRVYSLTTEEVEKGLKKMEDHIAWIKDLATAIQEKLNNMMGEIKSQIIIFLKEIELMEAYFKDCFDELPFEQFLKQSVLNSCIENLKELQQALQKLRISLGSILDKIRELLAKDGNNPALREFFQRIKREVKLTDDHCSDLMEVIEHIMNLIDQLLNNYLSPTLRVFHEQAYEERNRGNYSTQSSRAL
jgi:Mg2+ and Co2+ transporter CorA